MPLSDVQVASIARLAGDGHTKTRVAEALGLSRHSVIKYWPRPASGSGRPDLARGQSIVEPKWEGSGEHAQVEAVSRTPIRTKEEAAAAAGVDETEWVVKRWKASAWTTTVKIGGGKGQPDAYDVVQNYGVRLTLERHPQRALFDGVKALVADLLSRPTKFPDVVDRTRRGDPYLLEVDAFDAHIGKLAWAAETGEDYDLRIAERIYEQAISDLLGEFDLGQCERVLFPIGNDFLHIDNARNETFGGTRVDTDGRLAKILQTAMRSLVGAVEKLAAVAPVDVLWVPGNHDTTTSYCLAMALDAHFRGTDRVRVDLSPKPRKYYRYGAGLIGFTHGDKIKPEKLPALMAIEEPQLWGGTSWREWHLGHFHTSRKWETLPSDTHNGVVVRYLRSLSATDAWHFQNGFVGGTRAAEAYRWRRDTGYAGHAAAHVRT